MRRRASQLAAVLASAALAALAATAPAARADGPPPADAPEGDRAADPAAARSLAVLARDALDAHHPEVAARLFAQAHAVDPRALWQLAAGSAWLDALDPDQAVDHLGAALAAAELSGDARARADERLALARRLRPSVAHARAATAAHDWRDARVAWEETFRVMPMGRALILAARAAEDGGDGASARRLFAAAGERSDLSAEDQRAVADAAERYRRRPPLPPAATSSSAPWWLVGGGAALAAGGVVMLLVGDGYRTDLDAIERGATDGVVTDTTRAAAASLDRRASTFTTLGWASLGAGATLAALGVGWLVGRPAVTASSVHVEATLGPTGLGLGARASF